MKKKLKEFYFSLQIKKYTTFWWLILYLFLIVLFKEQDLLAQKISSANNADFEILKEYLQIVLSWPVIVMIIFLVFTYRFSQSIAIFLEKADSFKAGPIEVSQRQKDNPDQSVNTEISSNLEERGVELTQEQWATINDSYNQLSEEKNKLQSITDGQKNFIAYLFERAEVFEFKFLDSSGFVYNTKQALLWLFLQSSHCATKDYFRMNFLLSPQVQNQELEKEAMFNALLTTEMIKEDNGICQATEKGERFLKHIGLIK